MSPTEHPSPNPSPTSTSAATGNLPPLPKIQSREIRECVFTHGFQGPQSDPSTDNEKLGQIGDQVFALAITDLIQDLYPHLRVGYASKVRDRMKRKSFIADICVRYGLHKQLNFSKHQLKAETQPESLRAEERVQVNVFKAYVGGLFREQGLEAVKKWLNSVFQRHVEDAYQHFRDDYYPRAVPCPQDVPQPRVPTASYPSPPSSIVSEGARPDLPSRPTGERQRSLPPRTNGPQKGSGRVGGPGSMGNCPEVIERRPRISSQVSSSKGGRRRDPGDTRSLPRRTVPTGARKQTRYGEAGYV